MEKIFALLLSALLSGCFPNENAPKAPVEIKNENANTEYLPHASRLEIPRLKGEEESLFLVKEVPDYGVNFCAEYDCAMHSTRWVAYRWDIDNFVNNDAGRTNAWEEDTDIPEEYRVTLEEHKNDDYDRGHMLASEDRQNSKAANRQTFLLSNIFPQYNRFNGGNYVWVNMEEKARSFCEGWTRRDNAHDTLYVVKGGTIDRDEQILEVTEKGLVVPMYFYMAFLYKTPQATSSYGYKAMAFWVEHTDGKNRTQGNALKKHIISIDELEHLTGIDFFCNLPDHIEKEVETKVQPEAWGFK